MIDRTIAIIILEWKEKRKDIPEIEGRREKSERTYIVQLQQRALSQEFKISKLEYALNNALFIPLLFPGDCRDGTKETICLQPTMNRVQSRSIMANSSLALSLLPASSADRILGIQ